jgi:Arc/MetJ-type ribon-helix-helix transcriptional regulator
MQISLPPKLEHIVKERMKTGQYSTPEAVVEDALVLLNQQPSNWTAADLKRGVEEGLKDFNEGRYLEFDESGFRHFIDELKSRISTPASKASR